MAAKPVDAEEYYAAALETLQQFFLLYRPFTSSNSNTFKMLEGVYFTK